MLVRTTMRPDVPIDVDEGEAAELRRLGVLALEPPVVEAPAVEIPTVEVLPDVETAPSAAPVRRGRRTAAPAA